jgi:Uma2 family endonuclease
MVLAINAPRTQVIETAPLLCLEVLSPDDNLSDVNQRAVEYLALGVPQTWIFDPAKKQSYIYSSAGSKPAAGVLKCGPLELDTYELFAAEE